MPDFKEIDPSRRKSFEFNQNGEDELVLLVPFPYLKILHYCLSLLLEKDKDTENSDINGYYIMHRGTFK